MSEPAYPGVGSLVLQATTRHPDRTAFDCRGGRVSYRALGELIRRAVSIVSGAGLAPHAPIVQITGNRVEAFALQMAAYLTGHPSVMLHGRVGSTDRSRIVAAAQPGLVVYDSEWLAAGGEPCEADLGFPCRAHGSTDGLPDLWDMPAGAPGPRPGADDVARIAFTGGTTGAPKGVVLSQRAMFAATMLSTCEMEWPSRPQFLVTTPITHAGGTLIPSVLALGGTVWLRDQFDADEFVVDVRRGANSAFMVPTMMYVLLDLLAGAGWSLPGLQMLLYGAASITPSRLSQSIEVFGPVLNQSYGQTEAPNTITLLTADEHRPRRLGSSGLPYAGVSVAILDEDGHPLPPGEIGEICVRGPQVMTGYLDQPDATALALRDGWLWTGDRGHVDDEGYVYHAGRSKDMIISGGYNIYPGEIEAVLDAQPGVVQSVVIGVPDEHWGEAVKALVVCRTGAVEEAALRAAVRHAKGSIHVPKSFEFVEALPLTPLGKPDRALIRTVHGASRRP